MRSYCNPSSLPAAAGEIGCRTFVQDLGRVAGQIIGPIP